MAGLVALAACLAWQLAGAVHTATVRHVTCVEHGALVEIAASSAPVYDTHGTTWSSSVEEGHHAHCDSAAAAATRIELPVRSYLLVARAQVLTSAVRSAVTAPIPLLALAPKSSPPA